MRNLNVRDMGTDIRRNRLEAAVAFNIAFWCALLGAAMLSAFSPNFLVVAILAAAILLDWQSNRLRRLAVIPIHSRRRSLRNPFDD